MAKVTFSYNEHHIEFYFNSENLQANATQMARAFNKDVFNFLRNENTKEFLTTCLNTANSRYLNIEKEEDLFVSKQNSGTWMHRVLALKFAAWLDPNFELWVYSTIDRIVFGEYQHLKKSLKESAGRKSKIEMLREELRNTPEFLQLEILELEERQASYSRGKFNRYQMQLFAPDNKNLAESN